MKQITAQIKQSIYGAITPTTEGKINYEDTTQLDGIWRTSER